MHIWNSMTYNGRNQSNVETSAAKTSKPNHSARTRTNLKKLIGAVTLGGAAVVSLGRLAGADGQVIWMDPNHPWSKQMTPPCPAWCWRAHTADAAGIAAAGVLAPTLVRGARF